MELILFSHYGGIMKAVESIQCDICHKFFLVNEKRYPITLGKHRNNATCQKAKEIHDRRQAEASTTAVANSVAETLFHPKESDKTGIGMTGASLIDLLHIRHLIVAISKKQTTQALNEKEPHRKFQVPQTCQSEISLRH